MHFSKMANQAGHIPIHKWPIRFITDMIKGPTKSDTPFCFINYSSKAKKSKILYYATNPVPVLGEWAGPGGLLEEGTALLGATGGGARGGGFEGRGGGALGCGGRGLDGLVSGVFSFLFPLMLASVAVGLEAGERGGEGTLLPPPAPLRGTKLCPGGRGGRDGGGRDGGREPSPLGLIHGKKRTILVQ